MTSEWEVRNIAEVCSLIVDCVNKTAPQVNHKTPYKMLRTTNIRNGRVNLNDCKFVERDTFEKWTRRASIKKGDIILTREAPLGEVGRLDVEETVFLGQRLMQYRANESILDSRFLLYSFLSPFLQEQFKLHEGSGSVVSHIRVPDCLKFKIKIPPLKEQKTIAHILGSLDDKIELNRQMNATLEAMAQALFKSWFVDFDPVFDNALAAGNPIPDELQSKAAARLALGDARKPLPAEIQALFPSSFVLTDEMGWIPEGWEVSTIGKHIDFKTGPAFKSNEFSTQGVKLARGDNVKEGYLLWGDKTRFWPFDNEFLQQYKLKVGDVLIGMDGSKVGKNMARVRDKDLPCLLVQRVARLRKKDTICDSFISLIINSAYFRDYVDLIKTGSAIPHISGTQIKNLPLILPTSRSSHIFSTFEKIASTYFKKGDTLTSETLTLTELRDTLLPKLLSGESRIPE